MVGDSKFGCGYAGPHLVEAGSTEALVAAVADESVTCIKLTATTYSPASPLAIDRILAIVAEEGQATLDGGGLTQLLSLTGGADVSLFQLTLRNGYSVRHAHHALLHWSCPAETLASPMQDYGGAINNYSGHLKMYSCVLESNVAEVRVRVVPRLFHILLSRVTCGGHAG